MLILPEVYAELSALATVPFVLEAVIDPVVIAYSYNLGVAAPSAFELEIFVVLLTVSGSFKKVAPAWFSPDPFVLPWVEDPSDPYAGLVIVNRSCDIYNS